jgi:hypothetical protein
MAALSGGWIRRKTILFEPRKPFTAMKKSGSVEPLVTWCAPAKP